MKFQYTKIEDLSLPSKNTYLALIDINIGKLKIPVRCLIDSGSPITIIHSPLAVVAGYIPADGQASQLFGIGGEPVAGYYHTIEMSFYGRMFKTTVFFSTDMRTPYCLLGQFGFFDKFKICFDLKNRIFEVDPKVK